MASDRGHYLPQKVKWNIWHQKLGLLWNFYSFSLKNFKATEKPSFAIIIINGNAVMTSRLLFLQKAAKSRINYVIRFRYWSVVRKPDFTQSSTHLSSYVHAFIKDFLLFASLLGDITTLIWKTTLQNNVMLSFGPNRVQIYVVSVLGKFWVR